MMPRGHVVFINVRKDEKVTFQRLRNVISVRLLSLRTDEDCSTAWQRRMRNPAVPTDVLSVLRSTQSMQIVTEDPTSKIFHLDAEVL